MWVVLFYSVCELGSSLIDEPLRLLVYLPPPPPTHSRPAPALCPSSRGRGESVESGSSPVRSHSGLDLAGGLQTWSSQAVLGSSAVSSRNQEIYKKT